MFLLLPIFLQNSQHSTNQFHRNPSRDRFVLYSTYTKLNYVVDSMLRLEEKCKEDRLIGERPLHHILLQ